MAPLRIEPCFGKRSENGIQSSSSDRCDVLKEEVAASQTHSGVEHVEEEAGAGSVETFALAGRADVLAGEASAEEVRVSDVGDAPHVGPNRSGVKAPVRKARSQ